MLEIIYRIYEIEQKFEYGFDKREHLMDCIICNDRNHFKELIRENYGNEILFRYSKKLQVGDLYCVIIAENCYNTERYFTRVKCKCDNCKIDMTSEIDRFIVLNDWEIEHDLFGIEEYKNKKFCSHNCKNEYIGKEIKRIRPNEEQQFYISRDMFTEDINGYIYKITKKSTGEFYIGQTMYAPVFRWGQHLKTDRFNINNILDYQFETLYIVPKNENILEVEKRYIQEYYKKYPELSLNIACTSFDINQLQIGEQK